MEIINIGIDLEEVSRFSILDKKLLARLFTVAELKYALSKKNYAQHLAVRFAAKEAVFKALPFDKIALKKIEIIKDKAGAPNVNVSDERAKNIGFKISLSHTDNYATAVVLVYKKCKK